jgi:hypothetical protein
MFFCLQHFSPNSSPREEKHAQEAAEQNAVLLVAIPKLFSARLSRKFFAALLVAIQKILLSRTRQAAREKKYSTSGSPEMEQNKARARKKTNRREPRRDVGSNKIRA